MSIFRVSKTRGSDSEGDGANRPFATIGRAITEAVKNDVIEVEDGDYAEALYIDKPLNIRAATLTDELVQGGVQGGQAIPSELIPSGQGGVRISPPSLPFNFSRDNIMPDDKNAVIAPQGSIGILVFLGGGDRGGVVRLQGLRVFGFTNAIRAGGNHSVSRDFAAADERTTAWPDYGRLEVTACILELLENDRLDCEIDPNTLLRRRVNCGTAAIRCDLNDCEVRSCVMSNADIGVYHPGRGRFVGVDCTLHNVRRGYRVPNAASVTWRNNVFNSDGTAVDGFVTVGNASATVSADFNLYNGRPTGGIVQRGLEGDSGLNVFRSLTSWQSSSDSLDTNAIPSDPRFVKAFRTPVVRLGLPLPEFVYFYNSFDPSGTPLSLAGRGPGDTELPFGGWEFVRSGGVKRPTLSPGFVSTAGGGAGQALGETFPNDGLPSAGASFAVRSPSPTACEGWPGIGGATSVACAGWVKGLTTAGIFDVGPHFYFIGWAPQGSFVGSETAHGSGTIKLEPVRSNGTWSGAALKLHVDSGSSLFWDGNSAPLGGTGVTQLHEKSIKGAAIWDFWVLFFRYATAQQSATGVAGWEAFWSRNGGPLIQATRAGEPDIKSVGSTSIQSDCQDWTDIPVVPGSPGVVIEAPEAMVSRGLLLDEAIYWTNPPLESFTPGLINRMYQLGLDGRPLTQFSDEEGFEIVWFPFGGKEYALSTVSGSWDAVRSFARDQGEGADLVVVDASPLNDFLVDTFGGQQSRWIGGQRLDGTLTWVDGTTISGFTNWAGGQPAPDPRNFVLMNLPGGTDGEWYTAGDPGGENEGGASLGALAGIMCRPA